MQFKSKSLLSLSLIFYSVNSTGLASDFPGKKWQQYTSPEQAGFSSEKLEIARRQFDESDAAGLIVVYNGKVLVSWGETARRFRCASIRKSFIGALYGIYVAKGKIDLKATNGGLKNR